MAASSIEILESADATLSRVQRALGITRRLDATEIERREKVYINQSTRRSADSGACMEVHALDKHTDTRRSSSYPFEKQVVFVAIDLLVVRDQEGYPLNMHCDVALLDVQLLDMMSPGQEGQNFVEEIRCVSFNGAKNPPGDLMTDDDKDYVRRTIALILEGLVPHGLSCYIPFAKSKRNIVLVARCARDLHRNLKIIGFDPEWM